ncbi:MBL fold metallo-hydrolase [Gryllotalpicola protaetiae]|uniref:MBL fold metallo-hydrolase n=1 Tax=Gryllotalpicola protaetiae TaxID=2419771 RepID=A0A387BQ58_9MICO|nr:MBL fold metallo-hydrolase [Gryllotalpicola protaetiae]AYG03157.1 MBL fold metallo-hydrolase [Gryllotalpicola protaetiae]
MEQIDDGVWSLEQPFSGTMPFTVAYLLVGRDGGITVIDPGERSDGNLTRLEKACERLGYALRDIRLVIGTHLHRDHVALVDDLRAAAGCEFAFGAVEWGAMQSLVSGEAETTWLRRYEDWGIPARARAELIELPAPAVPFSREPDRLLADGETIALTGRRLRVITTPGHTPGHLCMWDPDSRLVFTGDHILPFTYSGLGLGGVYSPGAVSDYLSSLDAVAQLPARCGLPGHEAPFPNVAARAGDLARHQLQRGGEVTAALDAGLESVWAIAATLTWSAGWENLHGFHLRSALAQTAMHLESLRRNDCVDAEAR